MQRTDFYLVAVLWVVVILIFYPLFYTDYIFTDEVVHLWQYKPGTGFYMFINQGRAITEMLFARLFSSIDHIQQVTYLRLFAFMGWLICIPIWYVSLSRIIGPQPGYRWLPFFTCLYLVTSLPFAISIQWASCMELFIANTAGLLSGTILYKGIESKENNFRLPVRAIIAAALLGLVSLFTYQNGMGCFLIPFLFHYISSCTTKKERVLITGVASYFLIYGVYYLLYKLVLQLYDVPHNPRTSLNIDIIDKLTYFFARPLERSFRFTVIVDEDSKIANIIYRALLWAWMCLAFLRFRRAKWLQAVKYIAVVMGILVLSYVPSLVVKENYASNRTMLALNCCLWLVFADMAIHFIKSRWILSIVTAAAAIVFVWTGNHNFRNYFLRPVHEEYVATRHFLQQHYAAQIRTVYVIRPKEDAFEKKFNVNRSMDEFGVPSSSMYWVPEDLVRQLVFEITGKRTLGQALTIKDWPDRASFMRAGVLLNDSTLLVDMPAIINGIQP